MYFNFNFIRRIIEILITIFLSFVDRQSSSSKVSDFCDWSEEISISNITEVRLETGGIGIEPGSLTRIYYSNDKLDIQNAYYYLDKETKLLLNPSDGLVCGGSYLNLTYILDNGNKYSLNISNGFIYSYFDTYRITDWMFDLNNPYKICHSFIGCPETIAIRSHEDKSYKYNFSGADQLEFREWPSDLMYIDTDPVYYVDSNSLLGCEINIYESNRFCYSSYETFVFEIVSSLDFSELFK